MKLFTQYVLKLALGSSLLLTTLHVAYAGPNQPPVAVNDDVSIKVHYVPQKIPESALLANDYDPDGDQLFLLDLASGGIVSGGLDVNEYATYPPGPQSGTKGYGVCDSNKIRPSKKGGTSKKTNKHCDLGLINLTILKNTLPTPVDDEITIPAGSRLGEISVAYLLGNDSDPDGDPLYLFATLEILTNEGSFLPNVNDGAGYYPELGPDPEFPAGSYEFARLVCDRSAESFRASALPLADFAEQHCTESTLTVHAVPDSGQWRGAVNAGDEWCQATNEVNSDHKNHTIKASPITKFVKWSAVQHSDDVQQYDAANPVPSGTYIGAPLVFTCSYRAAWDDWAAVVNHFDTQLQEFGGKLVSKGAKIGDPDGPNDAVFHRAHRTNLEYRSSIFNPDLGAVGITTSIWMYRCSDPSYPPRYNDHGELQGTNAHCIIVTDAGYAGWWESLCDAGGLEASECEKDSYFGSDDAGLINNPGDGGG